MNTRLLGRWGEEKAAEFLEKKKYKITAVSYRTRFGEIDIIAENKKYIAFVEVKLRKSDRFASGREFVDIPKQKKIILAAEEWLSENETKKQPRFDVVEVYAPNGTDTEKPEIRYYENAFEAF